MYTLEILITIHLKNPDSSLPLCGSPINIKSIIIFVVVLSKEDLRNRYEEAMEDFE
jgi:hypothetical protein